MPLGILNAFFTLPPTPCLEWSYCTYSVPISNTFHTVISIHIFTRAILRNTSPHMPWADSVAFPKNDKKEVKITLMTSPHRATRLDLSMVYSMSAGTASSPSMLRAKAIRQTSYLSKSIELTLSIDYRDEGIPWPDWRHLSTIESQTLHGQPRTASGELGLPRGLTLHPPEANPNIPWRF